MNSYTSSTVGIRLAKRVYADKTKASNPTTILQNSESSEDENVDGEILRSDIIYRKNSNIEKLSSDVTSNIETMTNSRNGHSLSTINAAERPSTTSSTRKSLNLMGENAGATSENLLFSMDNIVRQIRDDIISRCSKIRDRVGGMRMEEKQDAGLIPEEYRADLEKRLADLMIVGERSGVSRHKLCVYELECHFHIKIAMVHLEGPTDSLDKAVQLYRMGQYSEALPMLEQQLEKNACYLHELIAGSMFNLGRIDDAGYHFQQAIKNMQSRDIYDRTVKTEKQQTNVLAAAKNAKAKAGESLKNKNYDAAERFYEMANDLFSSVQHRREAVEGMILCIGGLSDVIQTLMKLRPVEGGSSEARSALHVLLEMYDKLCDILTVSELDDGFQNQCRAICLNILGVAFENTGRFTSAIGRYRDSQEAYSKLSDDRQRILRMRECVTKARHVVRSLIKKMGGVSDERDPPTSVRQGMSIVLQMHDDFMVISNRAKVEATFRAENQAESLNSIGIGHYELREFDKAEAILQDGIDIMKENFGGNCRHITLAQLLYNLGLLYQDIGQLVKARNCFEEARSLYNKIEDIETRKDGIRKTQEALEDIE